MNKVNNQETIYALSSAKGRGGVAVIRVSGASSQDSFSLLTGYLDPDPRKAIYCEITDPKDKLVIDKCIAMYFKAPSSFTGEDIVEYHIHGSPAIIKKLLGVLSLQPNHRMAEPGEFTKRAFVNGKFDLTEAEAVADLINAETELQRQQAMTQMSGHLSSIYSNWREKLTKILAYVEADIDFSDEELPEGLAESVYPQIKILLEEIRAHLDDNRRGERLRDGISVVILGQPNAGKSSLFNVITQREAAIVSNTAGTTRDIIDVHLDIAGYPVILSDTAGLRPEQIQGEEGHDAIESEGIRRAIKKAQNADIRLLVLDTEDLPRICPHTLDLIDENCIVCFNKAEIDSEDYLAEAKKMVADNFGYKDKVIEISAKNNIHIDRLINKMVERIESIAGIGDAPSLTRERHRNNLQNCALFLDNSMKTKMPELIAEDVRLAIKELGRITGYVDVEELLDVIFRDFCIGK